MRTNMVILGFTLLLFCSCSWERTEPDKPNIGTQTRGLIRVQITENQGVGAETSDAIKTVRFIVFTDLASMPKAEANKFYDVAGQPSGSQTASKLKTVLEVSRKANGPNDKLVVAIVNEPTGDRELTDALNAVKTPKDLAGIELKMSHFLNGNHMSLLPDAAMPMSGAVWTDTGKVYATVAEAESDPTTIVLERAVAKVEVYMNTDMPDGMQIAANSYITLSNTYTKSRFVRHKDNNGHVLGNIQTVVPGDFTYRSWVQAMGLLNIPYKTPSDPNAPKSVHLCTFYTPERSSISDKLMLDVGITTSEGVTRDGTFLLEKASNAQQDEKQIDIIRRNSIYKVTATVGANGITAMVMEWNSVTGDYPIPEQYSLKVDPSSLAFPFAGGTQTVTVTADHPDGWRIDNVTNLPVGQFEVTKSADGKTVEVTANPNSGTASSGSFTVKAGNLSKTITVTQAAFVPYPSVSSEILCPPGVLGMTASGELTLRGSREYKGTPVEADSEFGPLHEETVYVVYYKWGSRIPIPSTGTVSNWNQIQPYLTNNWPSVGSDYGDPCPYATTGTGGTGWHVPYAGTWNNPNTPNAAVTLNLANGKTIVGRAVGGNNGHRYFFPYAGYRYQGPAREQGATGWYPNMFHDSSGGHYLRIKGGNVDTNRSAAAVADMATPIRCVK